MLEGNKYKHKIDKKFFGKVESKFYENLKASKIVKPWAYSNSSNFNKERMVKMRVKNIDRKLTNFQINYIRNLALEKNK